MSSVDIYIVVEGQTEQTFVRDVLAPQMAHREIYLHPALIGKPGHKGGDVRFERAKNAESRFIPYIEMHEFEALLFSDADILAEKTEIDVSQISEILKEYNNPEEINDDPVKAPSKQLMALKNGYRKVANGKTISEAIGIQTIRRQCAHFNNWLAKFEHLQGGANGQA